MILKKFDPNSKEFGDQLLQYFQEIVSQNIDVNVKTGWIKKEDNFPIITITKGLDTIQKLEETKIVSISVNIWCNDKKSRDSITNLIFNVLKKVLESIAREYKLQHNEIELTTPRIINFEEKRSIYRCAFDLTFWIKVTINERELKILKDRQKRCEYFEKLILGESSFGGDLLESENKKLSLFNPDVSKEILALIKDNRVLWKKRFQNLVSFDFARDGSYAVAVAQLTKKEMGKNYKSGGHVYIISKEGKVKDIKISCDGLSCSIAPDNKNFVITTMGPEWGVYYFDNKGKILWKKRFDKRVGGIELTKNKIILYDKMHKETRKVVIRLDKKGEEIKQ